MQDEITKHGLKIYKTMKDRKHSYGEKLKEIIIEIGIIVFAVTLSIWLHSWSESKHEQKEVKEFLRGLKGDLADDVRQMKESRQMFGKVRADFFHAYELKKGELPDSALKHLFYYNILVTQPNTARYEGFKSSSKLSLIESDSLRQDILVYYQQLVPAISYNENFVNQLEQQLLDFNIDKSALPTNEFLDLAKTRSLLKLTANNIQNCLGRYDTAIRKANVIIQQIDHELK